MAPAPAVWAFRAIGIARGRVIVNRRDALQNTFARASRKISFLDFMMTSIEINSVNTLSGSKAWRARDGYPSGSEGLNIRLISFSTSRSLLWVPGLEELIDHEQRERRELSVWSETLVNRKIMPDREYRAA
jgi:hypothetical protein